MADYHARPYLRWTYLTFSHALTKLIKALRAYHVTAGSVVITFIHNCAEQILLYWASCYLGCIFVPINVKNIANHEEISHMITTALLLNETDAQVIIFAADESIAQWVATLRFGVQSRTFVVAAEDDTTQYSSFAELVNYDQQMDTALLHEGDHSSYFSMVIFTSGTTSLPKGVRITADMHSIWLETRKAVLNITEKDVVLVNLPNNHAFYYISDPLFKCYGAATIISGPSFTPQSTVDAITTERCTY
ncbi:hypothetical protein LTR66_017291, partial [Elasticomyces elasticus]